MSEIIKHRQIVADEWRSVADDEVVGAGPVIVSLVRFLAEREALLARGEALGVRVPPDVKLDALAGDLPRLALIAVEFPVFKDGRGFSVARLLRERYGFHGEIRAVGDVLRDQLFFMERSGFDAFAVRPGKSLQDALAAFDEFSVTYQAAADDPRPLFRRRG